MIRFSIIVFTLIFASSSYGSNLYQARGSSNVHANPITACQEHDPNGLYSGYYYPVLPTAGNGQYCRANRISSGQDQAVGLVDYISGTCPSPLVDDGNGNCIDPPPECTKGETTRSYHTFAELDSSPPDPTVNIDGCEYFSTNVEDCGIYDNGEKACYYAWEATGEPAPSGEPDFEPPLPENEKVNELERCKAGDFAGTFNGESMCISPSGTVSEPQPYVVNGEKTISDTVTTSNPDGTKTKTTTKETTKNNGAKTTTVVTQIVDGTTGEVLSEESETEGEEVESSFSGGGSCDAPPVCNGDPIQCAIATQNHEIKCALQPPDNSQLTAENLGITEDDTVESLSDEDSTFDISELLDTSGFLGRSCPAPKTVNLNSLGSFTLNLSPLCTLAGYVGIFVLVVASFVSIRIIGR